LFFGNGNLLAETARLGKPKSGDLLFFAEKVGVW